MEIKELIKNARTENGFTQERAAEELCVSRQTISNWENGKSLPDIISILKMSDLYHISLDELLKGDKKMVEKIKKDANYQDLQRKCVKYAEIIMFGCLIVEIINIIRQLSTKHITIDYYSNEMMVVPLVVMVVGCLINVLLYKFADKFKSEFIAKLPIVVFVLVFLYVLFDTVITGVEVYREKGGVYLSITVVLGIILAFTVLKFNNIYYKKKKNKLKD